MISVLGKASYEKAFHKAASFPLDVEEPIGFKLFYSLLSVMKYKLLKGAFHLLQVLG